MFISNKINKSCVAVVDNAKGIFLRSPGKANFGKEIPVVELNNDELIINEDIAEMFGLKVVKKNHLTYKSSVEELVSRLNNWMEKHSSLFENEFVEDVVGEAGFGFSDDEPEKLQYVCGDDLCVSKYSITQALKIIDSEGINENVINKLKEEK